MSEKALQAARVEILKTLREHYSEFSVEEAQALADELLDAIDWDNPALMHKGISWITLFYMNNRKVS